jgi:hypothetical protein
MNNTFNKGTSAKESIVQQVKPPLNRRKATGKNNKNCQSRRKATKK